MQDSEDAFAPEKGECFVDETESLFNQIFPILQVILVILSITFQAITATTIRDTCSNFDRYHKLNPAEPHGHGDKKLIHYCDIYHLTAITVGVTNILLLLFLLPISKWIFQCCQISCCLCCPSSFKKCLFALLLILTLFVVIMQSATTCISSVFAILSALISEACKNNKNIVDSLIRTMDLIDGISIDINQQDTGTACFNAINYRESSVYALKTSLVACVTQIILLCIAFRQFGKQQIIYR